MSPNLFSFFRKNSGHKDLSFLDVSYLRHDPTTQTLMLYNNATRSVRNVRLVVMNSMKQSFMKDFERLGPRSGYEVTLDQLTDSVGLPFKGILNKIVIHCNNTKSSFEPENNNFRKIL